MRDRPPSPIQQGTPMGGSLNLLPMTYRVSDEPIGDEALYGPLAYVTETTRKKIMATGYGEMKMHVEYIEKSIGYVRKSKSKRPNMQLGLDLGE